MNNNTTTAAELLALVREQNSTLPEVMLRRERELNETPPELVYEKLRVAYGIMRQAVEDSLREPGRTMGGLIGGEAIKLQKHHEAGKNLCGETVSRAICYAMGVLEVSASMGLIVAAPTAGASGVLPGVLIALQQQYDLPDEKMLDALLVGVGQAVATLPGVSRSGMTITTGCFVGYERKFAVRFSFLLSIPAVLGANILSIGDAVKAGIVGAEVPMYLVGVVTAAVVGYLCIRLLKFIAEKGRFGAFAYYCWAVGVLTLVLQGIK